MGQIYKAIIEQDMPKAQFEYKTLFRLKTRKSFFFKDEDSVWSIDHKQPVRYQASF